MTICYLSLGSNIEDRIGYLSFAISQLRQIPGLHVKAVSPVYETKPVGGPEQDSYLNAVVKVQTGMPPKKLLEHCQRIETMAHRVREERWGPRTLDVDVIMVGMHTSEDPLLELPHPRAHERAFVLVPLRDIEKHLVMPKYGKIAELIAAVSADGVEKFASASMIDGTDD